MLASLKPEEMIQYCNEDPCHKKLGVVGDRVGKKEAVCHLDIEPWHLNIEKVIHGGILSLLMDTTLGFSVYPHLEVDERILAIDLKINFIKAATLETEKLLCRAQLVSRTRRLAVSEGELLSPTGEILCKAIGTFAILKKREPKND